MKAFKQKKHRYTVIILWAIITLGTVLRIFHLAHDDLWFDEAQSVISATDLSYALQTIKLRYQPPLYYIIMHFIIEYFGDGILTIRAFSAIFSILSLPLIFILGRRLYNEKTGLLSMLIMAFSPFHIWYAQEARLYSLSVFVTLAAVLLFTKTTENKHSFLWWATGLIVSVIGIYINYLLMLAVVPAAAFYFPREKNNTQKSAAVLLAALIILLPLFYLLGEQILIIKDNFWSPVPRLSMMFTLLGNFILGYNSTLGQFFLCACASLVLIVVWLMDEKRKKIKYLLLACAILPVLYLFFVSRYFIPIYVPRYFLFCTPFFYILLSYAIVNPKYKKQSRVCVTIIAITTVFSLINYYRDSLPAPACFYHGAPPKKEYTAVVNYIKNNLTPGDIIVHPGICTLPSFLYYFRDSDVPQVYLTIPEAQKDLYWKKVFSSRKKDKLEEKAKKITYPPRRYRYHCHTFSKEYQDYTGRIWLILSSWLRNGKLDDHAKMVKKQVERYFKKRETFSHDGIYVELFSAETKDGSTTSGDLKKDK